LLQRALRRTSMISQQLQHALDSRVIIEQAKGALAARLGISPDEAFDLLRRYARRRNRQLADIADMTIHGTLSPGDLVGTDARPVRPPRC
jgi:AmiR/NasT family two-component response regulator